MVSSSRMSGKKLAYRFPSSQPPEDEMEPVTPNSAAAAGSAWMSLSSELVFLNAGTGRRR